MFFNVNVKYYEKYLINRGFNILYRNYFRGVGELDIVAEKDNLLTFIEVKSVSYGTFVKKTIRPEDHVTHEKLLNIYNTAELFLKEYNLEGCNCRVDLITIIFKKDKIVSLKHFTGI